MFFEKLPRNTNFAHQLPLHHVLPGGYLVSAEGRSHKTIATVLRVWEPDTRLLDQQEIYLTHVLPLVNHFASEDSVGVGQQMQIIRYVRPSQPQDSPLVAESLSFDPDQPPTPPKTVYQDFTRNQQAAGAMPEVCTYLFLSFDLGKKIVASKELERAKAVLERRTQQMGQALAQAGYRAVRVTALVEALNPIYQYFNPRLSKRVEAPYPSQQIALGQLDGHTLARYPDAAVDTVRRQLAACDYAFSPTYVVGDGTYQAFLSLATLPGEAAHGLAGLFTLNPNLYVSQTWLMSGKTSIANELEKRHRTVIDLQNSFGDRVANLGLADSVANTAELRRDLAGFANCARYTLTIRVTADSLEELEQTISDVQNQIGTYNGAALHRETGRARIKQTFLQASPAVPQGLVDYGDRSHIVRCDLLAWFVPRYGAPASDPYTPGIPYILFWTPEGNLCRKALQGPTSGTCMLMFGPPGTGKGVAAKAMIQQLAFQKNQYTWTIDNNTALTSYDFQTLANGGLNVRFSNDGAICLPAFDIAGTTPTGEEQTELIKNLWLDIQGELLKLKGEEESLLTTALLLMYRCTPKPTYDTLVEILLAWVEDERYRNQRPQLVQWAGSLERFCSGPFLSRIKNITDHPDGAFYSYFGKPVGLRVRDLADYPTVSWSLVELINPFLKMKTAAILRKVIISYAQVLKDKAKDEGNDYYLNLFIDEGWGFFALDGGAFLMELTRRRRHFGMNVFFITQFVDDLLSEAGEIVQAAANQWLLLGVGQNPERLVEALKLTATETTAITNLRRVPGVYGQVLFKRARYNGDQEVNLLTNPIPCTSQGSWLPVLTGAISECNLRQQLLQVAGAESLATATPDQCRLVSQVMGQVWPNGLPTDSTDTEKRTKAEGMPVAVSLIEQWVRQAAMVQRFDAQYPVQAQPPQATIPRKESKSALGTALAGLGLMLTTFFMNPVQAQTPTFNICIGTDSNGQTYTYTCDLKLSNPQDYSYTQSPGLVNSRPGDEYEYNRQQELLVRAITLGQTNQQQADGFTQQASDTVTQGTPW
ncbi:hypothetical protein [Candidatus Cyanaurora vandensis]|uniref:hypothetical protein n=1 Tax=Candidatus Cyanaurora vandensis TaxID=2714958 RepID=UPI00257D1479|nr:hypothetical protein [Candidatus Cyanaurora vandensis]